MNLLLNTNICRTSLPLRRLIITISFGLVALHVHADTLVLNGSFEIGTGASVPGWSPWYAGPPGGGGWGIYTVGQFAGANVTDGTQALDLGLFGWGAPGGINQDIPTVPGQHYLLSFDWGSEYGWGVQAFVAGTSGGGPLFQSALTESGRSAFPALSAAVPWILHHEEILFTANANSLTLSFSANLLNSMALDFGGLVLDNVAVHATTQPSLPDNGHTLALMGFALTGLTLVGKRRQVASAYSGR